MSGEGAAAKAIRSLRRNCNRNRNRNRSHVARRQPRGHFGSRVGSGDVVGDGDENNGEGESWTAVAQEKSREDSKPQEEDRLSHEELATAEGLAIYAIEQRVPSLCHTLVRGNENGLRYPGQGVPRHTLTAPARHHASLIRGRDNRNRDSETLAGLPRADGSATVHGLGA